MLHGAHIHLSTHGLVQAAKAVCHIIMHIALLFPAPNALLWHASAGHL